MLAKILVLIALAAVVRFFLWLLEDGADVEMPGSPPTKWYVTYTVVVAITLLAALFVFGIGKYLCP